MPIYEYHCRACGHELDVLQKLSEAPLKKCPECGKPQLRRLVSAPVFRLKGGGWYETDFKSDGEKKRNLVETAGGDSSAAAGDKSDKSEKSEPKAESAREAAPAKDSAAGDGAKPAKAKPGAAKKTKPRAQSARR